ncbi:hypothetical protein EBB79_11910 [Parasedimentitalea marina]|uniref:Aminoglycoside phosphotransferase domain-containing protein n=1 Tax=Parasedimentitalea marina TaxID=2483033 RepID=A0A3T0N3E0_9RHOB|nr:phosphotransferase [Parasedimentitalea marina]AZV78511.1 hypothetical protein EBB79_11910 [Parasedimentitalea marina]
MGSSSNRKRLAKLVEGAEAHFGEKVVTTSAPGGEGRASWRFQLESRSVIATLRPNFRRTHLEAFALTKINQFCSDIPECLGVVGEIMFQSDVGGKRLNQEIVKLNRSRRADVSHEAIAAIFRIQSAAQQAGLNTTMPHLGANTEWIENLVKAVSALEPYSAGRSIDVDSAALAARIACPASQFVKWDCRSGNAAIGDDNRLRWFDFEYCGVRHGAEDVAWLLGDEAWPMSPETMEQIVIAAFDPNGAHKLDPYLDYLAIYLTLHCVQRFKLIIKEVHNRGWLSKTRVRKYDDAGVHPEFAAQICRVGAYFAARDPLTAPIGRDFENAEKVFQEVLRNGNGNVEGMKIPA